MPRGALVEGIGLWMLCFETISSGGAETSWLTPTSSRAMSEYDSCQIGVFNMLGTALFRTVNCLYLDLALG